MLSVCCSRRPLAEGILALLSLQYTPAGGGDTRVQKGKSITENTLHKRRKSPTDTSLQTASCRFHKPSPRQPSLHGFNSLYSLFQTEEPLVKELPNGRASAG